MTRILQISDCHLMPAGGLANGVVDTNEALRQAVETINRAMPRIGPIDLAIVTGDVADGGHREAYAVFRSIMADLDIPYAVVPGNHDHRETLRAFYGDADWMPKEGPILWRRDLPTVTVLGLDSLVQGVPYGELSDTILEWLADQLTDLGQRQIMIALHHPPVRTGIALMDRQPLRNPAALASALDLYEGNVTIVAGHAHRLIQSSLGRHRVLVAPGVSHAVTLDLGQGINDTLHFEPGAVMLHCFDETVTSHLVHASPHPGPFPFR